MIDLAAEYTMPADPAVIEHVGRVAAQAHPGYGDDEVTARVRARFAEMFGPCDVVLATNGSAANVLALAMAVRPWESIVCTEYAHVCVDETGDVERFTGAKLLPLPIGGRKLTPADLDRVEPGHPPHTSRPRVLTVTNASERGEIYTPAEMVALVAAAHERGWLVHVDGARFANAVAVQAIDPRALTVDCGVDLLSFGFTKNGGLVGDAVLSFTGGLFTDVDYVVKQAMQLVSRGGVLAASVDALLDGDRWLANARHANAMARRLAEAVRPHVELVGEPVINQVFAMVDPAAVPRLQEHARFLEWPGRPGLVRWVTSHATTEAEVDAFAVVVRDVTSPGPAGLGPGPRS